MYIPSWDTRSLCIAHRPVAVHTLAMLFHHIRNYYYACTHVYMIIFSVCKYMSMCGIFVVDSLDHSHVSILGSCKHFRYNPVCPFINCRCKIEWVLVWEKGGGAILAHVLKFSLRFEEVHVYILRVCVRIVYTSQLDGICGFLFEIVGLYVFPVALLFLPFPPAV